MGNIIKNQGIGKGDSLCAVSQNQERGNCDARFFGLCEWCGDWCGINAVNSSIFGDVNMDTSTVEKIRKEIQAARMWEIIDRIDRNVEVWCEHYDVEYFVSKLHESRMREEREETI